MKKDNNYLDYIPVRNSEFVWEQNDDGVITIERKNTRWAEKLTQLLMKRPKVTKIELEEYGNFIWPLIDGQNSVYDIAQLVSKEFGDKAEPLYDRIVMYFRNMYSNKLITMK